MKIEVKTYDLQRMIMLLDGAEDALDKAAAAERRREAGKFLRSITAQDRAIATRKFVAEMAAQYNVDLGV